MKNENRITLADEGGFHLEYDSHKNILYATLPHITPFALTQVNYIFQILVKTIMTRNIKNLLIDSSRAEVKITPEQHLAVMRMFVLNLYSTNLKKMARVTGPGQDREARVDLVAQEASLSFAFRNFPDVAQAENWLLGKS